MFQVEDPSQCLRNDHGYDYYEFSCLYPAYGATYTQFEKSFSPAENLFWMRRNSWVPVLAVILYGVGIVAGQRYMANKPRFHWRYTLAAWNLFLSVFSFMGMIRTLPVILHYAPTQSLRDNVCGDPTAPYGLGSTGLWAQLFTLSKFPELFDTFFIIIHKKPLIFLHWYHHVTVLLYTWFSYTTASPSGMLFSSMNYAVHSSMYFYYFLVAMNVKPKWLNPAFITGSQIAQMIMGVAITLTGYYFYSQEQKNGGNCHLSKNNNTAAFLMYGSYLFLFAQFFVGRYVAQPKKKLKAV